MEISDSRPPYTVYINYVNVASEWSWDDAVEFINRSGSSHGYVLDHETDEMILVNAN